MLNTSHKNNLNLLTASNNSRLVSIDPEILIQIEDKINFSKIHSCIKKTTEAAVFTALLWFPDEI